MQTGNAKILIDPVDAPSSAQLANALPTVLCLSSNFLTDRMLLYGNFLAKLSEFADPVVWCNAAAAEQFPPDHPYQKYFQQLWFEEDSTPYWLTIVRHFGDYVWDQLKLSYSRESFWRWRKVKEAHPRERFLRAIAPFFPAQHTGLWLEKKIEAAMLKYGRSITALKKFEQVQPSLLIAMGPFLQLQMSIAAAARSKQIPLLGFITSWDNITTKTRLNFDYDGYLVWSEQMKRDLHQFYPRSRQRPVYIVGAPQYDVFRQSRYQLTRQDFCAGYQLDPARPLIVFCLGSPNLFREDYAARQFLERIKATGELSEAQIIIRPHPGFRDAKCSELTVIKERFAGVVIQGPHRFWQSTPFQGDESILEWVNTMRHADVVINLSSTISVDAAIFDTPVVNINFDGEPGQPNQELIKEVNRDWNHFKPLAQSGGLWLVNDIDELIAAVKCYLKTPELHRAGRKWIVDYVCDRVDGQCGERIAQAVADFWQDYQRCKA